MNVVLDTSVIIAVITNESHKNRLIEMTKGAELIAPSSLHWEVGNAFSAMFRRNRITLRQSIAALNEYRQIPLKFHDIDLAVAIQLSHRFRIYAYDAYFLACSLKNNSPLISLDSSLVKSAQQAGIEVLEVAQ
jgi:predicted nucleic acid-binding protein